MDWTKIPTDLLKQRISDREIIAIVKYQLLWADLEYQPDDATALRYMTDKQLLIAKQWLNTICIQVVSDINSVIKNRNKRKISYRKNNNLNNFVPGTLPGTVPVTVPVTVPPIEEKRGEEKRGEEKRDIDFPAFSSSENKKYVFEGEVIKLSQKDFNDWQRAYPDLNLYAECVVRDSWLKEQPESERKKWFMSTAAYFAKQNERRKRQNAELANEVDNREISGFAEPRKLTAEDIEKFMRG